MISVQPESTKMSKRISATSVFILLFIQLIPSEVFKLSGTYFTNVKIQLSAFREMFLGVDTPLFLLLICVFFLS